MNDVVLAQYNEVTLKLGHRQMFVGRLVQNLREALGGLPVGETRSSAGRVIVDLGRAEEAEVVRRLGAQPGIANLVPARACAPDIDAIESVVHEILEWWRPEGAFRVDARRADKSFPIKSPDIGARLGAIVAARTGAPVDLRHAPSAMRVLVAKRAAYVTVADRVEGPGGLPVSTGGRVLLLLSGGIDSPVAGLRMLRRGCRLEALHFHSVPYLNRTSQEKARRLCGVLARGQCSIRLTMIAFGDIQSEIVRSAPKPLRVVLYRRIMMRIASRVAREDACAALVTGESLGQVASQTLTNMAVIEAAAGRPLLRPLVGMDKLEIIRYAERNDTFRISIVPDQDCCSLFVPKHPSTGASLEDVEAAEGRIDVEGMVERAVAERQRQRVTAEWELDASSAAAEL
ncbi:MAG: tRNA uracil 4-sulfurtransferase ThiI [Candidatus Binatia bacterium]